jgi:hypothetical protein
MVEKVGCQALPLRHLTQRKCSHHPAAAGFFRWRNEVGAAKTKRVGKVLNDHLADWREAWALFPGHLAYVRHGSLQATTLAESLVACGFAIRSQIRTRRGGKWGVGNLKDLLWMPG